MSFPPPDRVWLKVTAVIPYSAARAAAAATTAALSAAGFLFHSLLFLGILCSIKPFACNTAGSAPSRSLLRSFLSSALPSVLPGLHPTPSSSLPCPPLRFQVFLIPPFPHPWQRYAEKALPCPPSRRKVQAGLQGPHRGPLPLSQAGLEGQVELLLESRCLTGSAGFSGQHWEGCALGAGFGAQLFLILTLATFQPTG